MPRQAKPSEALLTEVRALICRVADQQLGVRRPQSGPGSWDLHNPLISGGGRKEDYLAVLHAVRLVQAAAEATVHTATLMAVRHGADFGELGRAEGITRQAARQREKRASARRQVRFVGGVRDGTTDLVLGSRREIRRGEWAGPWERYSSESPLVISVYRAKYGVPDIFEFHHYEDAQTGKVVSNWGRRPRISNLAYYWYIDSKTVLAEARKLDPAIKTPASRLDLELLEPLREALVARRGGEPLRSALPRDEYE
jgi:hypothetical protein